MYILCVCIPYNCTVHGADLTNISLLVILCIIVYVTNKILNLESWIRPERTSRPGPLGQRTMVSYIIARGAVIEAPFHTGRAPPGMGSAQPVLAESSTCSRQTEPRSRHVVTKQGPLRGMDTSSADSSENLGNLWQGGSRPLRLKRQFSLPNLLFQGQGCAGLRSDPTGNQANQGAGMQSSYGGPALEKPTLVSRAVAADHSSPVAHSPEEGSPLSGEQDDMAPLARAVGPTSLATRREPACLPECVLNTISQARAPATRRLYVIKWSVFSAWCLSRSEDPAICDVSVILSFLQELLDKGCSPTMLKDYVAAIAASQAPIAGQVGRDNLVVRFLRGASRLNPPRPSLSLRGTCPLF